MVKPAIFFGDKREKEMKFKDPPANSGKAVRRFGGRTMAEEYKPRRG
jgi:hypothetical protein